MAGQRQNNAGQQQSPAKRITTTEWLANIEDGITAELDAHASAIPSGFNRQRFTLNCIQVMKDNSKSFNNIAPQTIVTTLAKGAYLGLDFFNRECYAIPYGGNAQFQTDYKGEIKLCKKYSRNPIKDIYAKVVREGDVFEEFIENGRQCVNFRPKTFNDNDILGAFAICLYKDGSMIYDAMSVAEIEKTRNTYSKAKNSQAWANSYGEMCKKTVLRRLCKMIDLDFDNMEQIRAFDEGAGVEFIETPSKHLRRGADEKAPADVLGPEVVDAEYQEVHSAGPEAAYYESAAPDYDFDTNDLPFA